jgi:membrane-associated protein
MKLGFTGLVLLCLMCLQGLAQDTLQLTLQNQYNNKVKKATVSVLNQTSVSETDDAGMVTIKALPADSVVITADQHESVHIAAKDIQHHTVVLKKHFGWKDLLTPMFYIINGGLWLLLLIVFAETGLFAGFFLPGDSLLFVAGIYSTELVASVMPAQNEYLDLIILWLLISLAGIIGNAVGYWFGRKVGPTMYHWKDNMLFKQHYLQQAHDFYDKHGGGAIIAARFLPVIRTFAPIIAGIVGMDKKKFSYYNIVGCVAWVFSMLIGGHFLQKWILSQFHFDLKEHLEIIIIVIVLVTTAPVLIKLLGGKKKK